MISKYLLRLGWNWNCPSCQHCISFFNVSYLLDNPAACITSLFRSKNEWVSFSWGFLRPNNWGESPNTQFMLSSWFGIWIFVKIYSAIWHKKWFCCHFNLKNHVYEQFKFQCHCDSHLCNSGVQTFSFKVAFVTRDLKVPSVLTRPLFRFIKVTFALDSSSSYLHISYT